MNGYYQLTERTTHCHKIAEHINKGNPGVAKVDKFIVYIKNSYLKECKKYVKVNCNLIELDTIRRY